MKAQEARKEAIKKLYSSYLSVDGTLNSMPYGENFTVHNDDDKQFVSKLDSVKNTLEEAFEDLYVAFGLNFFTISSNQFY
ncbi:MAG: hypothetical protein AN482_12645 [Anabaena sp. LE011-02]|nr:hypothetical protein [Dolichospermum sp.]OBQ08587.1 MAG: hypothetical protein AN482_12645 [Anabaena sp. LE011-02]